MTMAVDGVVVEGRPVPEWVSAWCRRSGRAVSARVGSAGTIPGGDHLSRLVLRPPGPPGAPRRVVASVRDLDDDRAVLTEAADVAADAGATLVLTHGVPRSFGERSVGLDAAVEKGERLLSRAQRLVAAGFPGLEIVTALQRAWPHEIVGESTDAGLLVVGGARMDSEDGLGLVALSAVQHAPCPVLLVPRPHDRPGVGRSTP
jgi:nucleotide-binding universal stress UspA family protein